MIIAAILRAMEIKGRFVSATTLCFVAGLTTKQKRVDRHSLPSG
jgi:hypothetical protein